MQEYVPMASPIMVIKKHTPEGSTQQFWLYVDYRKLNLLLPTFTPTPGNKKSTLMLMTLCKIDELFAFLKRAKFFTALDLWSGYYYIKVGWRIHTQKCIHVCIWTIWISKINFQTVPRARLLHQTHLWPFQIRQIFSKIAQVQATTHTSMTF